MNRQHFINKYKPKHSDKKLRRKSKVYYSVSCPECGEPKSVGSMSLNRFGYTKSKKLKCLKCGSYLNGCK